jgi:hypothetical protein
MAISIANLQEHLKKDRRKYVSKLDSASEQIIARANSPLHRPQEIIQRTIVRLKI